MLMRDRQSSSRWSCYTGVAIDGPMAGAALDRVPTYLCQLGEWLAEHPDSEILAGPVSERHTDPRHGHGSWFHFGCRGPHPHALATMVRGTFDERLPEHELVLGVCHAGGAIAFPLSEIHRSGCLVQTDVAGEPVVAWARAADSAWMAGFRRRLDGVVLDFTKQGATFQDVQTRSVWSVEGKGLAGPLAGKALDPLDFVAVRWSGWWGFQPETVIYRAPSGATAGDGGDELQSVFSRLGAAGFPVQIDAYRLLGSIPPAATRGLTVRIGGDRFAVFRFLTPRHAQDYARSRRLLPKDRYLSFFPGDEPSDLPRHARVHAEFVLESDPEPQYTDPESLVPLPEGQIAWSALLDDPRFMAALDDGTVTSVDGPSFGSLFAALEQASVAVRRVKPMLRQWLRPGAVDGYSAELDGDRFLVYEFATAEGARRYQAERHHTLAGGRFVLRSDPPGQYQVASEGTLERPVDEVPWSRLLDDGRFTAVVATLG